MSGDRVAGSGHSAFRWSASAGFFSPGVRPTGHPDTHYRINRQLLLSWDPTSCHLPFSYHNMEALIDDLTQIQQSNSAPPGYAAPSGGMLVMAKFQQNVVQLLHLSSSHSDGQKRELSHGVIGYAHEPFTVSQAFVSNWSGKSKPHVRDIFVVLQNSSEAITHLQHHKAYEFV